MSMTLAFRDAAPEPHSPDDLATVSGAPAAAIAATRATKFLRGQAQWLERGLRCGNDRIAVGIVMGAHDRSHDRWVATIRHVAGVLGDDAANALASVYAYVGRVAGSLERGAMELLDESVAEQVRQHLAERLSDVTEAAVEIIWQAAAEA